MASTDHIRNGKGSKAYIRARKRLKRKGLPCWICGYAIPTDVPANHPQSFTADHYVPLNAGGELLGELRPAHRGCNSRRGDALDEIILRPND